MTLTILAILKTNGNMNKIYWYCKCENALMAAITTVFGILVLLAIFVVLEIFIKSIKLLTLIM